MFLHTIVLFATMTLAQPVTADFFGIEDKIVFNDTVKWIGFDSQYLIDEDEKTVEANLFGYDSNFQIIYRNKVSFAFPSQALPIKQIKGKLKDEAEIQLPVTYNGLEK